MADEEQPVSGEPALAHEPGRGDERGDAAGPDAPTSGEENEGLSTVLSADPLVGVQPDAADE